MEDLKEIIGEELFNEVLKKLGDKYKIDIVNNGQWIPKSKFDDVIKEKNQYKQQLEEIKPDAEALEQKKQELWEKEKKLTLDKHNLGDFKDFFHVDNVEDLEEQINAFKGILEGKVKENQKQSIYSPQEHKSTDEYAENRKKGNVQGMLQNKLANLF